jgi:GTP-binding protein
VARPQVITKIVDGVVHEPFEMLVADVEESDQGSIIQGLAERGGKMVNMYPDGKGRVRLEYTISSRGLIGFRTDFINMTRGTGLLFHNFDHFGPAGEDRHLGQRYNGVMISNEQGKVLGFALFNLQERGAMIATPGDEVYEGQIVGIHSRDNDMVVNALKGKKLTNMRASGSDENIILTPPRRFSLEQALEFINDDELVELTPGSIRIRKKFLKEHERKRTARAED